MRKSKIVKSICKYALAKVEQVRCGDMFYDKGSFCYSRQIKTIRGTLLLLDYYEIKTFGYHDKEYLIANFNIIYNTIADDYMKHLIKIDKMNY